MLSARQSIYMPSVAVQTDAPLAPPRPKRSRKRPAATAYTDEERRYYRSLSAEAQAEIDLAEEAVGEINDVSVPARFRVLCAGIPAASKAVAVRKLDALAGMDPSSGEYHKLSQWMDAVCRMPFGRTETLPVSSSSPPEDVRRFLTSARARLDAAVHGHAAAKDQIVRILAQWVAKPDARGAIIGIHGPMGCGKTTLIKDGICPTLGLPFAFVPLGGASDAAFLEGHSYTYEGSTWGRIADVLLKAGCMNPVLYFDELDKVSETRRGDEIVNVLIHLADQSQNDRFQDRYFSDFELDLSRCLIFFSFNDESRINPILRDRMQRIETAGYGLQEKQAIARGHLVPGVLHEHGMTVRDVEFCDGVIADVVAAIEPEEGVRNLKRALQDIVSHLNLERIMSGTPALPHSVTTTECQRYLVGRRRAAPNNMMYI